jgi:hypothetical protein
LSANKVINQIEATRLLALFFSAECFFDTFAHQRGLGHATAASLFLQAAPKRLGHFKRHGCHNGRTVIPVAANGNTRLLQFPKMPGVNDHATEQVL